MEEAFQKNREQLADLGLLVGELKVEIERLKFLNTEERKTIDELSGLCLRAADALETFLEPGEHWEPTFARLIAELRKAAG